MNQVEEAQQLVENLKKNPLKLNLTRGLPSRAQEAMSKDVLEIPVPEAEVVFADGKCALMSYSEAAKQSSVKMMTPILNYGALTGLECAKNLLSPLLRVAPENVVVGGPSSLFLMGEVLQVLLFKGADAKSKPWANEKCTFICPVPGYDRHHDKLELYNINMIPVAIKEDGPDMDEVERLVKSDPSIKGMWAIPVFSNPTGTVYSDEVINRLCSMQTAASDFRLFVDDAYCVHGIDFPLPKTRNFIEAAKDSGNPDRVFLFTSTSKITIPGAGICALGASTANIKHLTDGFKLMGISLGDKTTQARHALFFKDHDALMAHMQKLGALIKSKRDIALKTLREQLGISGEFATWTEPVGGYFFSVFTKKPIAKEVVALGNELGVQLTPAGAAFPYRKDPNNNHLRIAFTFPPVEEVGKAIEVVCAIIKCL